MDYCSSCRRYLNGALVCPGCGAYAPDIDPAVYEGGAEAPADKSAAGTARTESAASAASGPWHDEPDGDDTDAVGPTPLPEGRAARRRQRARWKKNQRRAVVATAVALVGGSLTVLAMDQQSGDRARAATAPYDPGIDIDEEPTGQDARPTTTKPDAPRSEPTPSTPERSAGQDDTGARHTAPSSTAEEPAAAPEPRTPAPSVPQQRTTADSAGSGDRTGTADTGSDSVSGSDTDTTSKPAAPAPTSPSADDGGTDDSSPGIAESLLPSDTTPPDEVCVLATCIG